MTIKVSIISLGCPKNEVDSEQILGYLAKDERFSIIDDINSADVVIVNTCGFIEDAKRESIDTILELVDKKKDRNISLVVTGCLAQRYKDEIIKEIPQIDVLLGIGSFKEIPDAIIKSIEGEKINKFDDRLNLDLNSSRFLEKSKNHYSYLKIAEGCDNYCTYCAIPQIRGRYRSRKIEDIVNEAKWLSSNGVKELILVAQDTSYYGMDIYNEYSLYKLLNELSKLDFKWIRFLYSYPERIDENLINAIKDNDNVVSYIDMPIQHINNDILRRMNRKITKEQIYKIIENIRGKLNNVTLRTSLIVGFPGESEKNFIELLKFVKDIEFDRLGCFTYSREEGTKSYKFSGQIKKEVKEQRQEQIMFEQQRIIEKKNASLISQKILAIVDSKEDGLYKARTEMDAPLVDCNIYFKSKEEIKPGTFVNLEIDNYELYDLYGKLI